MRNNELERNHIITSPGTWMRVILLCRPFILNAGISIILLQNSQRLPSTVIQSENRQARIIYRTMIILVVYGQFRLYILMQKGR